MKRMVLVGVLAVVTLAGCGTDSANTANETSSSTASTTSVVARTTSTTPSVATVVPPLPAAPPAPAEIPTEPTFTPEAEPPELAAPPEVVPPQAAGVELPPEGTEMPHGEALYLDICQRFLPAIDALESTGAASREQSVAGMSGEMTANASWPTVSADDQQQILRGLEAAGNGSC